MYSFDWKTHDLGSTVDYKEWMFRFYKHFKPDHVLEIGLGPGGSALCYFLANPTGQLLSIDIERREDSVGKVTRLLEYVPQWKQLWGESQQILREFEGQFDMVYVDGDHRTFGAYHDALYGDKLLKENGLMLFDDAGNVWKDNICAAIDRWKIDCPWYEEQSIDLGIENPDGPRFFRKLSK